MDLRIVLDGVTYNFAQNYDRPANREAWRSLLDSTFQKERAIGGLNQLMGELANKGHVPEMRRKIVIAIPFPYPGDKLWGKLDGSSMNFDDSMDRIKAVQWYINEALTLWDKQNYNYLQLAGFYWNRERMESKKGDDEVVREVSKYIHNNDLDFYWIPYCYATGAEDWQGFGFDIGYQQPNYFFNADRPYSLLKSTVDFANRHKMTFEMEFNDKMLEDKEFLKRFYDYLYEYRKNNVWETMPVAYYQGSETWLKISQSQKKEIQEAYDSLSNILIRRKYREISFQP